MLVALASLLVLFALIRLAIWAVTSFLKWLEGGKKVSASMEEQFVEDGRANELRTYAQELDDERSLRHLGEEVKGERPMLTVEERKELKRDSAEAREAYLGELKLTWYQIVMIFLVGSVLGLIIEQVWMFVTAGLTESRVGLVWGPYSPIYGFGAVLLTIACWKMRKSGATWWQVFLISMVVGGLLEQVTGWGMETLIGAVSWDYTSVPGCITKWVAWPFLFFWGALGLVWSKAIMPELLFRIGNPTTMRQIVFVSLLALYLAADIFMTVACFGRTAARDAGIAPANPFEEWVDENYTDQFIAARFQNMTISSATGRDAQERA